MYALNVKRLWGVVPILGAVAAGLLSSSATGAASVACQGPGVQPMNVGSGLNELLAVSVVSAREVLAVGDYFQASNKPRALIERWNGSAWSVQASPDAGSGQLVGVSATSSRNAWAVGGDTSGGLIEHWNGTVWRVQASPRLRSGQLLGVAATSSRNAWAVGYSSSKAVIEHWNGKTWKIQATLHPPQFDSDALSGVAVTSATNVWAVGATAIPITADSIAYQVLIEHWNGKTWRTQHHDSQVAALSGVAASSPTNAWAIGANSFSTDNVLIEHWNGKTWTAQPSAGPGASSGLEMFSGVSVKARTPAWVVGSYYNAAAQQHQTLALRCGA